MADVVEADDGVVGTDPAFPVSEQAPVSSPRRSRTTDLSPAAPRVRQLLGCLPLRAQHLDTAGDVGPPLPQQFLTLLPELIEVDEPGLTIGVEQSGVPRDPAR